MDKRLPENKMLQRLQLCVFVCVQDYIQSLQMYLMTKRVLKLTPSWKLVMVQQFVTAAGIVKVLW